MAVIRKRDFEFENQNTRNKKGKLIRVDLGRGRAVKMYEKDAAKLLGKAPKNKLAAAPKNKLAPAPKNKLAPAPKNKLAADVPPDDLDGLPVDNLTEIDGIGPASAKKLNKNGILTFAQLKAAGSLPYLSETVNEKIERWRGAEIK